jgi:4-amino-4-deoxy-L-arabinose transferase-like glycosyltransferase
VNEHGNVPTIDSGCRRFRATPKIRTILIVLAAAKLCIHLFTSQGYGFFRDEFYYIACSEHLDWGYVDHPPLLIILLWGARRILGDSLFAIRFLPAVAGALTVYIIGLMTRELGGQRFAVALAMVAAIVVPEYLGLNHVFSMNAFDILFWSLSAYLLIRILKGDDRHLWILLGLVLGVGLENKISVLWMGVGLGVGLLVTPSRKWLATPWPWISAALALVVFAPYITWQVAHEWPTLEFIENATTRKMAPVSAWDFLAGQTLVVHPLNLPIWLSGLAFFLFLKDGHRFRLLGWMYVVVVVILVSAGTSRSGYLVPTYTWLLAAGGVVFEKATERTKPWLRAGLVGLLCVGGLVTAPLALPVLPVET